MTILEIMEKVGVFENPKKIMAYVQDGLNEMQHKIPEKIQREFLDIVADTRYYNLPTTMIRLEGVFAKYDSTKWVRIPRIQNVDILEDSGESTASSDDEIIVV
jgi:hypothetical protein